MIFAYYSGYNFDDFLTVVMLKATPTHASFGVASGIVVNRETLSRSMF